MLRTARPLVLPLLLLAAVLSPVAARAASTLDNLQAAFDGESNARARYTAFAKKADEEGFAGAAALFRAAARAEGIHLSNHAATIKSMGATPRADVKAPVVGTTRENLAAAAKGEAYEQETMYPQFIAQARAEGNKAAVRTFRFARAAEGEHLALYQNAVANLETWRGQRGFWVCPECGSTLSGSPTKKCDVCFTKAAKFIAVA